MGSKKNMRTVSENLFSLEQSSSWVTENISYFVLKFSRDWSGVDSVIESMTKICWPLLIRYRNFCDVAFVIPCKVHHFQPFQQTLEQKRATEGCSFLRVPHVLKPMAPRPMLTNQTHKNFAPLVKDTARWPPRPAMAFSRDRGRGPVGSKEQLPFSLFMQKKSCSRKLEVRIP